MMMSEVDKAFLRERGIKVMDEPPLRFVEPVTVGLRDWFFAGVAIVTLLLCSATVFGICFLIVHEIAKIL